MDYSKFSEPTKKSFRKKLADQACKHIETVMIYPLSQFEQSFGYIWGHGKDKEDLTPEQLQLLTIWRDCRNRILNNGNKHKRFMLADLEEYDVFWHRYKVVLVPQRNIRSTDE